MNWEVTFVVFRSGLVPRSNGVRWCPSVNTLSVTHLVKWIRLAQLCSTALLLASCGQVTQSRDDAQPSPGLSLIQPVGRGTACNVHGQYGSPSYAVHDIGIQTVPKPSESEQVILRRIERYFNPPTLRFAYLGRELIRREFIVFNATLGPCAPTNYMVLNGACNEAYSPTDDLMHTGATPGCPSVQRPWRSGDPASGKVPWRNYYTTR